MEIFYAFNYTTPLVKIFTELKDCGERRKAEKKVVYTVKEEGQKY